MGELAITHFANWPTDGIGPWALVIMRVNCCYQLRPLVSATLASVRRRAQIRRIALGFAASAGSSMSHNDRRLDVGSGLRRGAVSVMHAVPLNVVTLEALP